MIPFLLRLNQGILAILIFRSAIIDENTWILSKANKGWNVSRSQQDSPMCTVQGRRKDDS